MDTPWDSRYDTGIGSIDAQHRELLAVLNRLRRSIHERSGRVDLEGQLHLLVTLAEAHLAAEEALMADSGYPDLGPHTVDHAALLERLCALEARVRDGQETAASAITACLDDWLDHHIRSGDQGFVAYLEERRRLAGAR